MDLRLILAIISGKLIQKFLRFIGHGGTSLPGKIARKIEPELLEKITKKFKKGSVFVTGTNGKTTTSRMIKSIFERNGDIVINNISGANLVSGLTTAILDGCSISGKAKGDLLLLEVDEATMPVACKEVKPDAVVVTNIFRDQLDRYTEIDKTLRLIEKGLNKLSPDCKIILNADDPRVASLGRDRNNTVYFGVNDVSVTEGEREDLDVQICDNCGAEYIYIRYVYSHLGEYRCPRCGRSRPEPDVSLSKLIDRDLNGSHLIVKCFNEYYDVYVPLVGVYNIYNALAAITVARAFDIKPEVIKEGLAQNKSSFGRGEIIDVDGKKVMFFLVKNPAGYNQVINTISSLKGDKYILMALNDKYADGTDVSWIWDVDFEEIARMEDLKGIITTGIRAQELTLRLKYAGIVDEITTINDMGDAIREAIAKVPEGGVLFVLPTYTCMLELRGILEKSGYVKPFWEG
ncbi:UDP-N-acetylmuramyl tripeptide synthase [Caldanaerobius fijiensis DSM 17918]|uniref:Lipid II isoglutaminyl synthase (glutamine-hydrolyzing) subunit MurT n=1 Tax=Caldanaerobius fijiensis DSM 17918 TaxID=1121256 RepID=A0A1M5AZG5_9THEO|nr:Mur ligase family protein [Caldanaerobius fijiensis]SHF35477.1 UDP-N-acetylmuramyl tripeptide synthase [Caldanaerobius fijiensis DSM 17918]